MKKLETSKIILCVSYIAAIILTSIVIIGTFAEVDVSNITQIALAAWAEVAATNVFYYRKAGTENKLKIYNSFSQETKDQIDINQMLNN